MKYLNLKKITAVVLSIGMVFSSSAVTGFAADNSKKIATIPNSYINKVAEEMTEYTSVNVMTQAATSILAQANERPSTVLQILQ